MAELTIRPEEIRSALNEFAASYRPAQVAAEEVGHVVFAADGIAHVEGLPGVMANELLVFEDRTAGLAMNLDERQIGVVVLGDFAGIDEGQTVRRTGEVLSVPVGDGYLGRVVDPLGRPIDGLGQIRTEGRRALELSGEVREEAGYSHRSRRRRAVRSAPGGNSSVARLTRRSGLKSSFHSVRPTSQPARRSAISLRFSARRSSGVASLP